ncbi:DNA-binding protein [Variovorax terrae]|uniref:DNA-binding protein n=1 Tax=Variovorax terrae TaxID=2923278 RepID=A0A9X1VQR5_9BURK|nr:DNA-binding protein [Variovorax terrae]MCJ0761592.1 DNA-binding protein [Variovorax terrae]
MTIHPPQQCSPDPYRLTTEEFAASFLVQPQSVRKRHCTTGSHHGARPLRHPNKRLLWPDDAIAALVNDKQKEGK